MTRLPNGRVDLGRGYQFVPVDGGRVGSVYRIGTVTKDSMDVGRVYQTERSRVIVAGRTHKTRSQIGLGQSALYQVCRAAQDHFYIA